MTSSNDDRQALGPSLLRAFSNAKFGTILADPPWQFQNRTGKMAPEHRRLSRYGTLMLNDIVDLPVGSLAAARAHLSDIPQVTSGLPEDTPSVGR